MRRLCQSIGHEVAVLGVMCVTYTKSIERQSSIQYGTQFWCMYSPLGDGSFTFLRTARQLVRLPTMPTSLECPSVVSCGEPGDARSSQRVVGFKAFRAGISGVRSS